MKRCIILLAIVFSLLFMFSCGGGGGDGTPDSGNGGDPGGSNDSGDGTDPQSNYYDGFDFTLEEGNSWEYYWSCSRRSGSQDSSSTASDNGSFTITLGDPVTIGDLVAYPIEISGKSEDSEGFNYAPKWSYIALTDSHIYGSTDGVNFDIVFIAASTQWVGGGFFTDFESNEIEASSSTVSNAFISTSAIVTERYQSQDKCTYYPGAGQICPNDESYTISEREYYKAGIGPIAYKYLLSYSNDGGGYTTWRTESRELGLVSTNLSLPGDFQPKYPPWIKKNPLTSSLTGGYCAAAYNGRIYLTGGNISLTRYRTLNIYDTATDSWSAGASMPAGRSGHASVQSNGKIYITGGYLSSETNTIYEYDPAIDTWSTVSPSMSTSRASHVAVDAGNGLIILGGSGERSVEFVYPGGSSGYGSSLPIEMNYMGGAGFGSGDDRRIYIMGGVKYNVYARSCNEAEYLSYVYKVNQYSVDWDWTACRSMPTVRSDLSVVELNDELFAIGGRNCNGATNVVEVYSPITNTWATASPMLHSGGNAATAYDGKIYVFYSEDGSINVEEYDPERE